jgi:hypothetical protein
MMTDVSAFRLAGNEKARFIFQIGSPATGLQFRLGFQDSTTAAQPTDGAWLGVAGITGGYSLSGLTRANSTVASTTNYTLASATWYRGEIDVNSNASRVDFRLYNDSGSLLWSDFLTTQIPTAAGRETGFGMIATESSVNAATDLLLMDYFSLQIDREIVR